MKKIAIFVILAMMSFGFFSTVSAEENETITKIQVQGNTGEVRFVTENPKWRDATEEEILAIKNPGKIVAIDFESVTERVGFWHIQIKQQSKKGIFLQKNNKLKAIYNRTEKIGEKQFTPQPVLLLIAILLIVIANVFFFVSEDTPGFLVTLMSLIIFLFGVALFYWWHLADFFLIALYLVGFFSIRWSKSRGMSNQNDGKNCSLVI